MSCAHPLTSSLSWEDRPDFIQDRIEKRFEVLTKCPRSSWGLFNGNSVYGLCKINEQLLLKTIIQNAPLKQRNFYVVDIGAGDFQWGKALANYINSDPDIRDDITVHVFNLRGESYFHKKLIETDRCKIYNLGSFKVEEIFEEFKKNGFDLEGKVDLAVSSWCFRHLVDPVGTFVQTYNLLRPESGFLMVDGFFFVCKDDDINSVDYNDKMVQLFLSTQSEFLCRYEDMHNSLNQFILRRTNASSCHIPMNYADLKEVYGRNHGLTKDITVFDKITEDLECESLEEDSSVVVGDEKLYDFLSKTDLFVIPTTWKPLRAKKTDRV